MLAIKARNQARNPPRVRHRRGCACSSHYHDQGELHGKHALNICSAGELRAEPRAMRLVNHPFRLDSPRLLSYLTSMRVLTLAVTPAISTTFWNTIYFYTASATAGNLSYDCARGRHCTVSAAASRRHVDAFLDLFTRESPRTWRDLSEKRALSARRLFLWMVGV